ncbi:MAG: hypothetical protein ACPGOV_11785 [Magnetovibrionaceae bacterium]
MVAYTFQKRFVPKIKEGTKWGTIRKPRSRQTRKLDKLQLYFGMRTKSCRKIRDAVCLGVVPIDLLVKPTGIFGITLNRTFLSHREWDDFARADGFEDFRDFDSYWLDSAAIQEALKEHPGGYAPIYYEWIIWDDRAFKFLKEPPSDDTAEIRKELEALGL